MDRYQTIINHILLRSVDCMDISLYYGKMGIVLALYLNAREQGKAEWEDWAWDLLQSVYAQLAENLPYDMEDGLVGIGYAVTLLKKNGIFDVDHDFFSKVVTPFSLPYFLLYALALFVIAHLVRALNLNRATEADLRSMTYNYQSLKFNGEVIRSLLSANTEKACMDSATAIVFGNPDAGVKLTVLTNPHCGPCAQLHPKIEELLQRHGDAIFVEYVFCSFRESLQSSARFLIETYLQEGSATARRIYSEWYAEGRFRAEAFFSEHAAIHWDTAETEAEMHKHEA